MLIVQQIGILCGKFMRRKKNMMFCRLHICKNIEFKSNMNIEHEHRTRTCSRNQKLVTQHQMRFYYKTLNYWSYFFPPVKKVLFINSIQSNDWKGQKKDISASTPNVIYCMWMKVITHPENFFFFAPLSHLIIFTTEDEDEKKNNFLCSNITGKLF